MQRAGSRVEVHVMDPIAAGFRSCTNSSRYHIQQTSRTISASRMWSTWLWWREVLDQRGMDTTSEEMQRERGKDFKKLGFLTDADRQVLDDDRIDMITKHARLLWNSLYREGEDLETWGVQSMFASAYFSNNMQIKFPEFHWCEGDWKVQNFATVRFPDWSQDVCKKGQLTRTIPFWFIVSHTACWANYDRFSTLYRQTKGQRWKCLR